MTNKKKFEGPFCVGCGELNRTLFTSNDGWINFCVNPSCGANGKILIGGPPIQSGTIQGTIKFDEIEK